MQATAGLLYINEQVEKLLLQRDLRIIQVGFKRNDLYSHMYINPIKESKNKNPKI